jgi:hypothetical protein
MHVWDLLFRCFRVVTDLWCFIRIIITTALSGLAAVRPIFIHLAPVVLVVAVFRLLFIFLVHKTAFLA